jgi:hypothetical protein
VRATRRGDRLGLPRVLCNCVPSSLEEGWSSSQGSQFAALARWASTWGLSATVYMRDLKTADLQALRETLKSLVSNLDETVNGLSDAERHSYDEAEQSVVDARRKAETHEGLLQVN